MNQNIATITITDEFHGTKTTMFAREHNEKYQVSKRAFKNAMKRICPAPYECKCGVKAFAPNGDRLDINHYNEKDFDGNLADVVQFEAE